MHTAARVPAYWEIIDSFGVITMNLPGELNCLSQDMVSSLLEGLSALESAGARAIVIRAQPGAQIWSAGHNIKEIPLDGRDPLSWDTPFIELLRRVRECDLPVIGLLEGSVWGAACDLAVTMDILVGSPGVSFAITPARLGLPYNTTGLTHFLGVLPLHIVKEMLFTARPLNAHDAYRMGLLNHLVNEAQLEETAFGIAREIGSLAPLAIRVLKRELNEITRGSVMSVDSYEKIQKHRESAYLSADLKEGVQAFLDKRSPSFEGK